MMTITIIDLMINKVFPILLLPTLFLSACATPEEPQDKSAPLAIAEAEASPFDKPWPLDFTRDQLNEAALEVAHKFFKDNSGSFNTNVNYFFEDNITDVRRGWEKEIGGFTLGVFSDYTYDEVNLVAGISQDFMRDTLLNNDVAYPEGLDISLCGIPMPEDEKTGCNYSNSAWFGYGGLEEERGSSFRQVSAHELYHTVQSATAGGHEAFYQMPQWFVEGSADFMGYAIIDYLDYYEYENQAHEQWHYLPNPETGLEFWTHPPGASSIPTEHYLLGQVAAQYIAVNVGLQGLLNVTINMGSGLGFPEAFEKAVGMSLTKFYALFDIAYAKMLEKDTGEWRTYENRLCPEEYGWDCTIDNYKNVEWWMLQTIPDEVEAPEEAENRNHDRETHRHYTDFDLDSCREVNEPIAISSQYAKDDNMMISTQWYAAQAHLDHNADGVVCGPGDVL